MHGTSHCVPTDPKDKNLSLHRLASGGPILSRSALGHEIHPVHSKEIRTKNQCKKIQSHTFSSSLLHRSNLGLCSHKSLSSTTANSKDQKSCEQAQTARCTYGALHPTRSRVDGIHHRGGTVHQTQTQTPTVLVHHSVRSCDRPAVQEVENPPSRSAASRLVVQIQQPVMGKTVPLPSPVHTGRQRCQPLRLPEPPCSWSLDPNPKDLAHQSARTASCHEGFSILPPLHTRPCSATSYGHYGIVRN